MILVMTSTLALQARRMAWTMIAVAGLFPGRDRFTAEDLDNDGLVNVNDILLLLGEFGCAVNCTFDLNGMNGVDVGDFLLLLGAYGLPCSN